METWRATARFTFAPAPDQPVTLGRCLAEPTDRYTAEETAQREAWTASVASVLGDAIADPIHYDTGGGPVACQVTDTTVDLPCGELAAAVETAGYVHFTTTTAFLLDPRALLAAMAAQLTVVEWAPEGQRVFVSLTDLTDYARTGTGGQPTEDTGIGGIEAPHG